MNPDHFDPDNKNLMTPEQANARKCQETALTLYCINERCMAWRWWSEKRGYCGKAGKP